MRFVTLSSHGSRPMVIACLCAIWSTTICAAEIEPYAARVIVARAQVRSGPGENFYPTDVLAQGESVEVYREQADGWLAIRPPRDSFSWVFGRHLKLRDDALAEVDKEEVASRIGSRFGSKRNAVQVQLRKGEVVEILGKETASGETWYKIAPPAGEFRWIHATNVKRMAPLENADADSDAEPTVMTTSAATENSPADEETSSEVADEPAIPSDTPPSTHDDWRAVPSSRSPSKDLAAPASAASSNPPPTTEAPVPTEPASAKTQAAATTAGRTPDTLARSLTDIELHLSRMVAAPPDQWNTERLERDAENLLAQAQTAAERDAVKSILAKLERIEAIGRQSRQQVAGTDGVGGHAGITTAQSSPDVTSLPAAQLDSAVRPTQNSSPNDSGRYDVVGILRPVVSKRPGAPQFALVDDRGQVISFVTPTPDMNLQPYLGHRVGVVGTRGFIPEFQRAHVTAGRVTPLSERVMR